MTSTSPLAPYQKIYADLRFERSGLFALIQETYHPQAVLYPGCSVHLTPAFYFPHLVFVDRDPLAQEFFAQREALLELVNRRKTYRRTAHIEFIPQDFTQPLPLPLNQFDLLLGLFTGDVAKACRPYLKVGGLLLTNNHLGDALDAVQDSELALVAVIQQRQGQYRLVSQPPGAPLKIENSPGIAKRYLRQTSRGVEYIEDERYYLFERVRTADGKRGNG